MCADVVPATMPQKTQSDSTSSSYRTAESPSPAATAEPLTQTGQRGLKRRPVFPVPPDVSDLVLPPLPPLPPPVGSSVRPSVSAGSPPPPTAPAIPSATVQRAGTPSDDRYLPPDWLEAQRGNNRTTKLNPKVVVLSVVGILAAFIAAGVIAVILAGTTQERFVEIPLDDLERPTFPDDELFIDSMADPDSSMVVDLERA